MCNPDHMNRNYILYLHDENFSKNYFRFTYKNHTFAFIRRIWKLNLRSCEELK